MAPRCRSGWLPWWMWSPRPETAPAKIGVVYCVGRISKGASINGRCQWKHSPPSRARSARGFWRMAFRSSRRTLTTGREFSEYLHTAPTDRMVRCVARVGWHGDTYVLPDRAIGPAGSEEILYQPPHEASHYWKVSGTLEEWRRHVGRFCIGNSRLILAVSCGFAGPILKLVGAESGGIHFHGATSTGKTTALVVGGSVCGGGGNAGFAQTWRTTINGLEATAEAHNDGTLFLDELAQVDPRDAADTAYLLANGQGKARMTRSIAARKKLLWTLLFVSSGELTLAEHASSAGKQVKGGVEVRLINIEADAGRGFGLFENLHGVVSAEQFVHQLKQAAQRYYGTPIRAFLECLVKDRPAVERRVRALRAAFLR